MSPVNSNQFAILAVKVKNLNFISDFHYDHLGALD